MSLSLMSLIHRAMLLISDCYRVMDTCLTSLLMRNDVLGWALPFALNMSEAYGFAESSFVALSFRRDFREGLCVTKVLKNKLICMYVSPITPSGAITKIVL